MTDSWNDLTPAERDFAAGAFEAASAAEDLLERARAGPGPALSARAAFALAADPDLELDRAAAEALRAAPGLAELFEGLVRRSAVAAFPAAAAAAGGGALDRRLADGFRVRLVPSRSTPGQTYAIVDPPPGRERPVETLFVLRPGAAPAKFRLPPPVDGRIQVLAESDSELVVGLGDPDAEVFLR